jgi:hypothetical protein
MRLPTWIKALAVLVALGYIAPYLVLTAERWWAAFAFWIVFGIAVWAILVARVAGWDVAASREDRR